jgi:hypothetical protein
VFAWVGSAIFPFQGKDPYDLVRALTDIPVFFIHGVEDPLLPFETTWQTYQATLGAKRLWLIPGVGHAQEPILDQDAEYAAQLRAFFHQADDAESPSDGLLPPIRCEISTVHTGRVTLKLRNPGPPGLVLTTIVRDQTVDFRTIWVHDEATLSDLAPGTRLQTSCLRLFEVSGCGDTAQTCLTVRGQRYRAVFQPYIRQLSQMLHEGRLNDLEGLLQTLPVERPEAPFDFFLGVYCAQIMHKTRRQKPRIARAAAEIWQRYWHYGVHVAPGIPTPWDLVSAVLGKQARPHSP